MTPAEILAAINELDADEAKQFAKDFHNDSGKVVAAAKARSYAAGKTKGQEEGTEAAAKLTAAEERVAALETELNEAKAKAPDAAAIETRVRAQLEPKLNDAIKRAEAAEGRTREQAASLARKSFLAALTAPAEDNSAVEADYGEVAEVKWGNRFVAQPDGSVKVLQIGSEIPYDAPDTETAVKLLAADARKLVPAAFVRSNADPTGGGNPPRSPNGVTIVTRPAAPAGIDAIVAAKRNTGAYSL